MHMEWPTEEMHAMTLANESTINYHCREGFMALLVMMINTIIISF